MGDSAAGAATSEKFLFRLRNGQSHQPHIRNRMGKNGRKPETEAKLIDDKYVKQEAGGASYRKPLSALCPAPSDDCLASGPTHSL